MVQRTVPRRPQRVPAAPVTPPAPAQILPQRSWSHGRDGVLVAACGLAGYGGAHLSGQPELATPVLLGGVSLAGGVYVQGSLRRRRREIHDRLVEALAPRLGVRGPDRRTVRMRAWTWGWPGRPQRISIRYGPGVADADPKWLPELIALINRRLGDGYELDRHDQRRCRLRVTLRGTQASSPTIALPALQARAERTLTELIGPTARVLEVDLDGDDLRRISVEHEAGTKLAAAGYRARVERTVSTVLPGRWRARWDLEADRVVFELRPSFPESIWLPAASVDEGLDVLASYDDVSLPYGIDEDGHEQLWRPALDPNLMVVGSPGTGKTVLEHTILAGVARYGWPIWVVDGKSIEFLGFRSWPNVQVVATTVAEQVAVIERAWQLMEHRYSLITSGRACEADFEPLMLFLDEFADFRANLMDWYSLIKVKGDPTKPPVLQKAASIARKGRSARVHLLFATQRPDAEYFGGDMRDNFRARISMGRLSPQGAQMMWQDMAIGTTIPRGCRGRATTINDANRAVEIQTYRMVDPRRVPSGDTQQTDLLARLRPQAARHERLLILPPSVDPDVDGAGGGSAVPTYRDYAAAEWVRASERPDLDPLERAVSSTENARDLASPLAIFGLGAGGVVPSRPSGAPSRAVDDPEQDTEAPVADSLGREAVDERFVGYGPVIDVTADHITIGDLVLVDAEVDHWAVVDEEPGEDPSDPDNIAICWRDDADDVGLMAISDGERIAIRRPLEEA